MEAFATAIPDVVILQPRVFADARGYFMESWNARSFATLGLDLDFVQDNHCQSMKGVLRGLHYQVEQPQGKLIRVTRGEIFDVAVDIRRTSPTFGIWVSAALSAENKCMLWVPPGFAHGYYVTSAVAEVQYKCTAFYAPDHERCIRWDDPDLAIPWPIANPRELVISTKDEAGSDFASLARPPGGGKPGQSG